MMGKASKKDLAKMLTDCGAAVRTMETAKDAAARENVEWTAMAEGMLTLLRCFRFVLTNY